jgi:hypothetical protein
MQGGDLNTVANKWEEWASRVTFEDDYQRAYAKSCFYAGAWGACQIVNDLLGAGLSPEAGDAIWEGLANELLAFDAATRRAV